MYKVLEISLQNEDEVDEAKQMKKYILNSQKLIEYIRNNFYVDIIALELIDEITQYLKSNNKSYTSEYYNNEKIYIESYVINLKAMLNNSRIDINLAELIDNMEVL